MLVTSGNWSQFMTDSFTMPFVFSLSFAIVLLYCSFSFRPLIISILNVFSILQMVSNDIFFCPFSILDIYCWVQFIFSASIRCVIPSSDIRLDMRTAIACEYCAQFLLSCPDLIVCDSVSKTPQGILHVTVFIETITLLDSVAKVAQIFEIAQLPGCCSVERNEMPCLNQRFREVETCRLFIHNGNELPCC